MTPYTCPVRGCTHPALEAAQYLHGICSVVDCDQPIQGACATCRIKVCAPVHGGQVGDQFLCQRYRFHGREG
jgi:hypothetical protein